MTHNQSERERQDGSAQEYDVAIAGAGPAGGSAAIQLAKSGVRVVLIEQKSFPRPKLCGEFISPECMAHFEQLRISGSIQAAGVPLKETIFYSPDGHNAVIPSRWFAKAAGEASAWGLSRARMDDIILEKAREAGATILAGSGSARPLIENGCLAGLRLVTKDESRSFRARIVIDATGASRSITRSLNLGENARQSKRAELVAFKAHLTNASAAEGTCEIYFYPGGYGGLNPVEAGQSNVCFIVPAHTVRELGNDIERVLSRTLMLNLRARQVLKNAQPVSKWISVALSGFGKHKPTPAEGLLTIGDAASFIDPFTGSGILIALQSGKLASETILEKWRLSVPEISRAYRSVYNAEFNSRLRYSALLRHAAFAPARFANPLFHLFGNGFYLRRLLAHATR